MMDISIRNVDVVAIKKIDELAKAKKMSRNEFLKRHIEDLAIDELFQSERHEFQQILNTNNEALSEVAQLLSELHLQLVAYRIKNG